MALRKAGAKRPVPKKRVASGALPKPVALTVKVDHDVYVRLCTFAATQRRTNQDILDDAVQQYLDKAGA